MISSTYRRIYLAVQSVPKGSVSTYGDIAHIAKTSARVVGRALHHNPDPKTIPCHRIVFANGQLANAFAFGGASAQRKRLISEGVLFNEHNTVSLKDCRAKLPSIEYTE